MKIIDTTLIAICKIVMYFICSIPWKNHKGNSVLPKTIPELNKKTCHSSMNLSKEKTTTVINANERTNNKTRIITIEEKILDKF